MLSPDLVGFVKEGLGRGLSRGEIEDILARAGWPADQVRRALAGFADVKSSSPPVCWWARSPPCSTASWAAS